MRKLILLIWALFGVMMAAGCNTLEGAGEDLQAAGNEVEEGTDEMTDEDDDML